MTAAPRTDAALRALVRELLTDILRESGLPAQRVGNSDTLSRGLQHTESGGSAQRNGTPPRASARPGTAATSTSARSAAAAGRGTDEWVDLRTDADLHRFVRRLLELFENPGTRAELRAGLRRFHLVPDSTRAGSTGSTARGEGREVPYQVPAGAVTERKITEAARAGATTVLLGRRAVLTPLAKEKARALGLTITRES